MKPSSFYDPNVQEWTDYADLTEDSNLRLLELRLLTMDVANYWIRFLVLWRLPFWLVQFYGHLEGLVAPWTCLNEYSLQSINQSLFRAHFPICKSFPSTIDSIIASNAFSPD